MKPILSPYRHE